MVPFPCVVNVYLYNRSSNGTFLVGYFIMKIPFGTFDIIGLFHYRIDNDCPRVVIWTKKNRAIGKAQYQFSGPYRNLWAIHIL